MEALGLIEIAGCTPAIAALDAMSKASGARVLQVELNDKPGVIIKIAGDVASVETSINAGLAIAQTMRGQPVSRVIGRPNASAFDAIQSRREFNPLIMQDVVFFPIAESTTTDRKKETAMPDESFALGLIETQGFTAVYEAIDRACKAANVQVVGKEKLGGGYITVVIKGDVAAVRAAVEAGKAHVEGLGKLIAAHVIPRPSEAVLSLLPKL